MIQKKWTEEESVRTAARKAALREIMERIKKNKDEKVKKVDSVMVTTGHGGKQATRAAERKAPKMGACGKRSDCHLADPVAIHAFRGKQNARICMSIFNGIQKFAIGIVGQPLL